LASTDITANALKDADILLCRSVNKINAELLDNTLIKFVATATSGSDHIDKAWLEKKNITWTNAPGCNARSVAEYVVCTLAALHQQGKLKGKRAGVIGAGRVGSLVIQSLQDLGFEVIVHDPLRSEHEQKFISAPLTQFIDLDLICIHAALTTTGNHPSFHLIEKKFLQQQKTGCVLLNAARGAIINSEDLKKYSEHLTLCLDVYEDEPNIDLDLIQQATICTPHIAGHAVQAKWHGAEMVYRSAMQWLKQTAVDNIPYPIAPPEITVPDTSNDWKGVVLNIYDPRQDTQQMKKHLLQQNISTAEGFSQLRDNYRVHHEFDYVRLRGKGFNKHDGVLLTSLGLQSS
ncbi:MAG: 4-phosphoerythronate dehydrogenase, partial [Gammaproteobacteria bacterium]